MSSRVPSNTPFIHTWLCTLPSSPSGFSATGAASLTGIDTHSERSLRSGPHLTQHHPIQPLQPAQYARGAQPVGHVGAHGALPPTPAPQHMPQSHTGPTRLSQVQSVSQGNHQTPQQSHTVSCQSSNRQPLVAKTHGPSISSQPGDQPQYMFGSHSPAVTNWQYNYNPANNSLTFNTDNQKHHVSSGLHHTTDIATETRAYYNHCNNVDDSGRDTFTQSMATTASGYSTSSATPNRDAETFGRAPSETIPLRRTRTKCTRGLFISKTISTHQHVVDDRPC